MLLSDRDLRKAIEDGSLALDPWEPTKVQPSSIDMRFADSVRVFDNHRAGVIDPRQQQDELTREERLIWAGPFFLHPGEFVLGSTLERVTLGADKAARLEGRSSLGRLGLVIHSTAGFIDPGFTGRITLELSNVANLPIALWPGMDIGQLCVFQLSSPAERPYGSEGLNSKYQGQINPTASQSFRNFNRTGGTP